MILNLMLAEFTSAIDQIHNNHVALFYQKKIGHDFIPDSILDGWVCLRLQPEGHQRCQSVRAVAGPSRLSEC